MSIRNKIIQYRKTCYICVAASLPCLAFILLTALQSWHWLLLAALTTGSAIAFLCYNYNKMQGQLRIAQERFRLTFESTDNATFEYDCQKHYYLDFTNSERLLGRTMEQINKDMACLTKANDKEPDLAWVQYFYHPEDVDRVRAEIQRCWKTGAAVFVARLNAADGSFVWCKVHLTVLQGEDKEPYRLLGFLANIDSVKRQSEVFRNKSEKDALTGFYNKVATIRKVNEELAHNFQRPHVLYVLDIDNFKRINDSMGHIVGDAVITETAACIRKIFRSDDILGRIGGDEFVVLVAGIESESHIIKKAGEIIEAFNAMRINAAETLTISVSIGIDVPTRTPTSFEPVFCRADKALYLAKRNGKNGYALSSATDADIPHSPICVNSTELAMEEELHAL